MYRQYKTVKIEKTDTACRLSYKNSLFCPPKAESPEGRAPNKDDVIAAAKCEAQRILNGARERAAEIVKTEREKAAHDAAKVKTAAYNEGLNAGKEEGHAKYFEKIKEADALLTEIANAKAALFDKLSPELVKISIEIADKYIKGCAKRDSRVIKAAVLSALQNVSQAEDITVWLSPADFESVDELKKAVASHLSKLCRIEFKADDTLLPCDVVVETELGTVEAGAGEYISEVKKAFADEFAVAL